MSFASLYKRINSPIRKNMFASFLGILLNIANQLVLIPFYIHIWGNELYGDWIVLTSATAFFQMTDGGLNMVTQNLFAIRLAEHKQKECDTLITNNILIIAAVGGLSLLLWWVSTFFFDIKEYLSLGRLTTLEATWIFTALAVNIFIKMLFGVPNAIYRATHNMSRGMYLDYVATLLTIAITGLVLYLDLPLTWLSSLLILPYIVLLPFKVWDAKKFYNYRFTWNSINLRELRSLLFPSVSFLFFPLGHTIVLQGYTLLVNRFFGADSVVLFNTTRTLCNSTKGLLGIINSSVWPEYSISYGEKDYERMRALHRKAVKWTFLGAIAASLALLIIGPYLYDFWTQGAIVFSYSLMASFLVILVLESVWTASSITLIATNNHTKLGVLYIASALTSLALAFTLASWRSSLSQVVLSLLVAHIIMATYTTKYGRRLNSGTL